MLAKAALRIDALELRKAGYSYRQIAEWLNPPCSVKHAFFLVAEACREQSEEIRELVADVRVMELERLDEMSIKPFEAAKAGDTRAIDAMLKIMERRALILGSDAPTRQEHSGPNGGPIPIARIERIIIDAQGADPALAAALPGTRPV